MDVQTLSEAARRIPQMAEWVRMRFPSSIFVSVSLFTAETTAALYLSSTYRSAGDQIWQGLTLLFTLVPSVLVQLTLTFIHRDLSRDRPLILLLHILQLGPIVRSVLTCLPPFVKQELGSHCIHSVHCVLPRACLLPPTGVVPTDVFFPLKNMPGLPAHKLLTDGAMNALRTCCCFHFLSPFVWLAPYILAHDVLYVRVVQLGSKRLINVATVDRYMLHIYTAGRLLSQSTYSTIRSSTSLITFSHDRSGKADLWLFWLKGH